MATFALSRLLAFFMSNGDLFEAFLLSFISRNRALFNEKERSSAEKFSMSFRLLLFENLKFLFLLNFFKKLMRLHSKTSLDHALGLIPDQSTIWISTVLLSFVRKRILIQIMKSYLQTKNMKAMSKLEWGHFIHWFAPYAQILVHKIASQKLGIGVGHKWTELSL